MRGTVLKSIQLMSSSASSSTPTWASTTSCNAKRLQLDALVEFCDELRPLGRGWLEQVLREELGDLVAG